MKVNEVIDKTFGSNSIHKHKEINVNIISIDKINEDDDNFYSNILQTIKQYNNKNNNNNNSKAKCSSKRNLNSHHYINPSIITKVEQQLQQQQKQHDCLQSPSIKKKNVDLWGSPKNFQSASKTSLLNPRKIKKNTNTSMGNLQLTPSSKDTPVSMLNPPAYKRKSACSNFRNIRNIELQEDLHINNHNGIVFNELCSTPKTIKFKLPNDVVMTQRDEDKRLEIKENVIQLEVLSDNLMQPFPIDILKIQKINSFDGYKMTKESESIESINDLQKKMIMPIGINEIKAKDNNNNIIIINQNGYNVYKDNKQFKKKRKIFCCIPLG